MPPGGILQSSIENLLSHSSEKIRRGTLLCFRKFRVSKNIRDKRGEEYQDFPSIFLSHSSEKFRRGTLLSFRKFRVSKNIRDVRGGGVSRFSVKNFFVSQYRNISFLEEPFYVSESFGYRKILCLRGE